MHCEHGSQQVFEQVRPNIAVVHTDALTPTSTSFEDGEISESANLKNLAPPGIAERTAEGELERLLCA